MFTPLGLDHIVLRVRDQALEAPQTAAKNRAGAPSVPAIL